MKFTKTYMGNSPFCGSNQTFGNPVLLAIGL